MSYVFSPNDWHEADCQTAIVNEHEALPFHDVVVGFVEKESEDSNLLANHAVQLADFAADE